MNTKGSKGNRKMTVKERIAGEPPREKIRPGGRVDLSLLGLLVLALAAIGTVAWFFLRAPPDHQPPGKSDPDAAEIPSERAEVAGNSEGGQMAETVKRLLAERDQARAVNETLQLKAAISTFFTEYRQFPKVPGAAANADTETTSNAALIRILTGDDTTGNSRGIRFFELPSDSLDSSGGMVDPWGNLYLVVFDSNYDNRIMVNGEEKFESVNVRSLGPKEKPETEE